MSENLSELGARRRILVLRCDRLRVDLGRAYGDFETRLSGVDRIFAAARGIAAPSILISVAGLGLTLLRRTHPFRWATRGVLIFSVVRRILGAVRALRASRPARR